MHLMGVADGFAQSRFANGYSFSGFFQDGTAHRLLLVFDCKIVLFHSIVWWYGMMRWYVVVVCCDGMF
jgi:hypothetical protein